MDGRSDAAAQAFRAARAHLSPRPGMGRGAGGEGSILENALDRLAAAAEQRAPLFPPELATGEAKTVIALSLGTIHGILRSYEASQAFFTLPLSGKSRSSSAAHRSFAELGLARAAAGLPHVADQKDAQFARAKSLYQQSLCDSPALSDSGGACCYAATAGALSASYSSGVL